MFNKKTNLFVILCGVFLTNAIIAELIGVKIFSLERTFGQEPLQFPIFSIPLSLNFSAGVVIWPIVFITSDIINEYFGKKGVRFVSLLTVALIGYIFIVIWVVTSLSSADFWIKANEKGPNGSLFDIHYAFNTIYLQGMGIIIGSLVAFLIGQLLDVFVFQKLRSITGTKRLWLRATGSTLFSQLIDSFIVLFIAFYLFGNWSLSQVFSVGILNYAYKFLAAILLTPILYIIHYLIDQYLGQDLAKKMMAEASEDTSFW